MKRIHFVTFSRSDYASLRPVALAAVNDDAFEVKVIAGGSHLLKRFGETIKDVKADGFPALEIVDFLKEEDNSDADMAHAYARAVDGMVSALSADMPDMVFMVGDRWEMLAVATAASLLRIPVAHHSGGDITQGSADNQTRYVLTTLSHLHFVALDEHRDRLRKMGEEPWRISVTGEPALTQLASFADSVDDIRDALNLPADKPLVLATFHPTSYDSLPVDEQIDIFTGALDCIDEEIVLTAPNPDAGSGAFFSKLSEYAASHDNVHLFESLGSANYYAAMAEALYMVGNSSSGLWEAPSFGLPVVNIGSRQDGRMRGGNVLDTKLDIGEIKAAIEKVVDPAFRERLEGRFNPYVKADTLDLILSGLKTDKTKEELLAKVFVDPIKISG